MSQLLYVIFVAIEQILDGVPSTSEQLGIFFLLFRVEFLTFEGLLAQRWTDFRQVWRFHSFINQSLPVNILEPNMLLDLSWSI